MPIHLSYLADLLMIAASAGAAIYCLILSRRLSRLTGFDSGIGGAIAVLSVQVDEMKTALAAAKAGSDGAGADLRNLVGQAREISAELELMIAACHDFAEQALVVQTGNGTGGGAEHAAATDGTAPDSGDADLAPMTEAAPVFGTRRLAGPDPMFRRHARA